MSPQYANRAEIYSRLYWAGDWPKMIQLGMLNPRDMPDTLTTNKAEQIMRIWHEFLTACGQMYLLIKEQEDEPA
ncbi:hypothetical protein AB0C33_02045 [Nonomuraea sp. NPDC048881]|uniref:hypothetical protein n=1 Tax=Nonomuraea sp. NPDC048881 TaxID=3155030 RepID=UPI0033EBB5AA